MKAPAALTPSISAAATMMISFLGNRFLAGACAAAGAGAAPCLMSAILSPAESAELPRLAHLCDQRRTLIADYSGLPGRTIGRIWRILGDCFGRVFRPQFRRRYRPAEPLLRAPYRPPPTLANRLRRSRRRRAAGPPADGRAPSSPTGRDPRRWRRRAACRTRRTFRASVAKLPPAR